MKKKLDDADYAEAAALLKADVNIIKAVTDVESGGKGFLDDGRLILRFEGHYFRRFTGKVHDASHPGISHPFDPKFSFNKGIASDYLRLAVAMKLDASAALQSCSWGMFQIMGEEFWRMGYKNVHAMVDDFKTGERAHLMGFCRFCVSKNIDDELRKEDFEDFAYYYNGKNYHLNKYPQKMRARLAYHRAKEKKR